jgi:hypothetical protein
LDLDIGIIIIIIVIALAFIFPGKTKGMWIFGLIPLILFGTFVYYGFSEAQKEFKENPFKAIFTFLFICLLGSGLLLFALLIFGFIRL